MTTTHLNQKLDDLVLIFPSLILAKVLPGFRLQSFPGALRTHILRLLGLKTISYKVFGPFRALGFGFTLQDLLRDC